MHLVYVDESGDPGINNSPTASYILSGLKIPAEHWHDAQARLLSFRHRMRDHLGLKLSAEIHAAEFLGGAKTFLGLEARQRLRVALWLLRELGEVPGLSCHSVACLKQSQPEPMKACWQHLAADLTSSSSGPMLLVADMGEAEAIKQAISAFRSAHPSQALIIEDPFHRDSKHSYFLQAADLVAYLQRQRHHPNALFRSTQPVELFSELDRVSSPARWLDK
jgi:hypothetical protein